MKDTFHLFEHKAGLETNPAKASLVAFNLTSHDLLEVKTALVREVKDLPVTYLGLSLFINLMIYIYEVLVENIMNALAGWEVKLSSFTEEGAT